MSFSNYIGNLISHIFLTGDKACQDCQPFVFQIGSDNWEKFSYLFQNTLKPSSGRQQTYENILKYLLHQMFQQKECITHTGSHFDTRYKMHMFYHVIFS